MRNLLAARADLVTLGAGSTVNRGCVVQTHLFHDRIMRMDAVTLEAGAALGPHCVALPASRIGAGATIGPASLVMRGDEVPPSTRWQGNPIAPWQERRKRARPEEGGGRGRHMKNRAKKSSTPPVIDPYLPNNGNFGYRVSRYELDLQYKVNSHRLAGAATITAVTLASLQTFTLDLSDALGVTKVTVNGRRPASFSTSGGKLRIRLAEPLPTGSALTIAVRYGGSPKPIRTVWGEVGFEELTNGALVAGQPNGSPPGSPATTIPAPRPATGFRSVPTARITRWLPGELVSRRVRAGQTVWTYEQPEPTSTYLATLQIGMYGLHRIPKAPVAMHAVIPAGCARISITTSAVSRRCSSCSSSCSAPIH